MTPSLAADLAVLTDAIATCRLYKMSLHANALRYLDRDPSFARLMNEAALAAGELADEYNAVALFRCALRDGGLTA